MTEVTSTLPTSRRGYLSQDELEQFTNITVTNSAEADDRISQAEEIIDSFAGAQSKYIDSVFTGRFQSPISSTQFTLKPEHCNTWEDGQFVFCEIEIIAGTGAGQRRSISESTKAGVITVRAEWTTTPDATSVYRIYQLGSFPRQQDIYIDTENTPNKVYKSIPEAIKRAVAAQVEYFIEMGDAFFKSDSAERVSESIGDYSYTNRSNATGTARLIAPKARLLINGFKRRTGVIVI